MAIRARRTIKLGKLGQFNFSKSGVTFTFGVKGAHVTLGKKRPIFGVALVGSGLSYRTSKRK